MLQAGIEKSVLTIALEPEAASLFCMHLPVEQLNMDASKSTFEPFSYGEQYMVVDIGGKLDQLSELYFVCSTDFVLLECSLI